MRAKKQPPPSLHTAPRSLPLSTMSLACLCRVHAVGKPVRVERLLANLGYGKRKECQAMVRRKRVTRAAGGKPLKVSDKVRSMHAMQGCMQSWCAVWTAV